MEAAPPAAMSRLQRRRLKEPGWIAEVSKFPVVMWEDEEKAAAGRANINFSCFVPTNEGSVYGNCVFKVDFCLIPEFPRKSPSLAFVPPIFHSNVEESAGSICWDATGPGWVASQVLHHVVEFDLPFCWTTPTTETHTTSRRRGWQRRTTKSTRRGAHCRESNTPSDASTAASRERSSSSPSALRR